MREDDDSKGQRPDPNYKVGYGKPPQHTRFKPGQGGNPKGHKKKPKSTQDQMRPILSKRIPITENGRARRITLEEAMLRSIANKAAKGDLRAANFVLDLVNSETAAQCDTIDESKLSAEDQMLFEQMMAELTPQVDPPDPNTEAEREPETQYRVPAEQEEPTHDR